jgi:hypothetical protein
LCQRDPEGELNRANLLQTQDARFWPRVCKNAHNLIVLGHFRSWLSDRTVNVAGRISRNLEYTSLLLQLLGWAKSAFLGSQRFHQTVGTHDLHDPFQVVGEHTQAHLCTHPGQLSRQEVRRTHPLFERPEGMLNRPFSDSHHLWRVAQPKLHFL